MSLSFLLCAALRCLVCSCPRARTSQCSRLSTASQSLRRRQQVRLCLLPGFHITSHHTAQGSAAQRSAGQGSAGQRSAAQQPATVLDTLQSMCSGPACPRLGSQLLPFLKRAAHAGCGAGGQSTPTAAAASSLALDQMVATLMAQPRFFARESGQAGRASAVCLGIQEALGVPAMAGGFGLVVHVSLQALRNEQLCFARNTQPHGAAAFLPGSRGVWPS